MAAPYIPQSRIIEYRLPLKIYIADNVAYFSQDSLFLFLMQAWISLNAKQYFLL